MAWHPVRKKPAAHAAGLASRDRRFRRLRRLANRHADVAEEPVLLRVDLPRANQLENRQEDAEEPAAGEEPAFDLAFHVLDVPSRVQRELRQRLDGTRPAPSG